MKSLDLSYSWYLSVRYKSSWRVSTLKMEVGFQVNVMCHVVGATHNEFRTFFCVRRQYLPENAAGNRFRFQSV